MIQVGNKFASIDLISKNDLLNACLFTCLEFVVAAFDVTHGLAENVVRFVLFVLVTNSITRNVNIADLIAKMLRVS